jgi:hypothetical protein
MLEFIAEKTNKTYRECDSFLSAVEEVYHDYLLDGKVVAIKGIGSLRTEASVGYVPQSLGHQGPTVGLRAGLRVKPTVSLKNKIRTRLG